MKYPKDVPVDEPVAKPKQAKAKTYPDSVPVDEPVKKMAKGGSTDKPSGFKVPIQQLPYMGEKPEARTPPPTQRSKPNSDVKMPDKDFKSGGVTRADGCISKGHTKGRMV